jgi:ComF family protein
VADRTIATQRAGRWLAEAGDALVSVFFPAGCRICEQLLTRSHRIPICDACLDSFQALPQPICKTCGSSLLEAISAVRPGPADQTQIQAQTPTPSAFCPVCHTQTFAFDQARSYAIYSGALARAIVMLKFERLEPLAKWFSQRLAEIVKRENLAADVVVPVPLHRHRERERGYNQADLVARPLAKLLGLPYRAVLLVRTRPRPDKHLLTVTERWESVRGAFATRPGSQVDKQRVLLVDDVLTSGATLDACSKALREAGAKTVLGLTIARVARQPSQDS